MLGRRLSDSEFKKINAMAHKDALIWASDKAIAEGRKPGYNYDGRNSKS